MTGYKKCIYFDKKDDGNYRFTECIVELRIPYSARVVRPFIGHKTKTNKLRCDKAVVKAIFSYDAFGNYNRLPDDTIAYSIVSLSNFVDQFSDIDIMEIFNGAFKYIVGKTVTPEYGLDDNVFRECSFGIHFFEKIEEATKYSGTWPFIFNIKDTFEYFNIKDGFEWFN